MRVFVSILCSLFLFVAYAHAALPDWVGKPLTIEPELLKPPEIEGMVFVKGGCYEMGDIFGDGAGDEKPVHTVCVDDFYIGKYEVTQMKWASVMGNNPSSFKRCDSCPVEHVSWNDVQDYIGRLNGKGRLEYRLPTEAEWEYAARSGGKLEKFSGTNDNARLGDYAWYFGNAGRKTHSVGKKMSNGLGLYDMTGNVWEWVSDWYGEEYYKNSPKDNPTGPTKGDSSFLTSAEKVFRGGSWLIEPGSVRTSNRGWGYLSNQSANVGFRLALSPE